MPELVYSNNDHDRDREPSEFRIPASDTKGHNIRNWFRCMPAMARQVEQVIQSKVFPYRTKGDLFRHALHRHMHWLSTIGEVPSVSKQVDVILEIMRDEEMSNDFSLVFEKMEERISSHMASSSLGEATRLVIRICAIIDEMPDGFWKDKYAKQIKDKYGNLIKNTPRCKFGTIED